MELIDRLKSPTPDFHKKLRNIALIAVSIAGAIIAGLAVVPAGVDLSVPPLVIQICWYIVVMGGAVAGVSQTPVVDGKIGS